MKKVILGASVLALTLGACTKKKSTVLPPPEVDTVFVDTSMPIDTNVIISGISDARVDNWGTTMMGFEVRRTTGLEQKVTMNIAGLPANAKAEWSAMSGYTTFNTSLTIKSNFVKSGTYPLSISSLTEKGKTKDYKVNLVVDSLTKRECNQMIQGNILSSLSTTDPSLDSVVYTFTSISNEVAKTQLYLRNVVLSFNTLPSENFMSYNPLTSNYHVKISFNCEDGKFTIPEQEVQGRSNTGVLKMFMIAGEGMVNLEKGTYSFTYTTEHEDGTTVVKAYTMEGMLYQ